MSVLLPTDIGPKTATPRLIRWGGALTPSIGNGPVIDLIRVGSRFAIDVNLPPMGYSKRGRIWVARLNLALLEGALLQWPQPGVGLTGNLTGAVNGFVSGGTSVPVRGLGAGQTIVEGQFLSVLHGGQRYLHQNVVQDRVADGAGNVTLTVNPPLRVPFSDGDTVEVRVPVVEGSIVGQQQDWTMDEAAITGLSFTIQEDE